MSELLDELLRESERITEDLEDAVDCVSTLYHLSGWIDDLAADFAADPAAIVTAFETDQKRLGGYRSSYQLRNRRQPGIQPKSLDEVVGRLHCVYTTMQDMEVNDAPPMIPEDVVQSLRSTCPKAITERYLACRPQRSEVFVFRTAHEAAAWFVSCVAGFAHFSWHGPTGIAGSWGRWEPAEFIKAARENAEHPGETLPRLGSLAYLKDLILNERNAAVASLSKSPHGVRSVPAGHEWLTEAAPGVDPDSLKIPQDQDFEWSVVKVKAERSRKDPGPQQRKGMTVTKAAAFLSLPNKVYIDRLVQAKRIEDNGQKGHARRIFVDSLVEYAQAEGITLNDT